MAIKSKEELLASIKNRFGEDTSDDALSLYEDLSDTITDFENKVFDNKNAGNSHPGSGAGDLYCEDVARGTLAGL